MIYKTMCKSLGPLLISLYFASKRPDFLVSFLSGLLKFFFGHWTLLLIFSPFLVPDDFQALTI